MASSTPAGAGQSANALPHAPEAERGLLGTMLQDSLATAVAIHSPTFRVESLYLPAHRLICAAIFKETEADRKVDHLTIAGYLRRHSQLQQAGGEQYLERLLEARATVANIETYIEDIHQAAGKRYTILRLRELSEICLNGVGVGDIHEAIQQVGEDLAAQYSAIPERRQRFTLISAPEFKKRPAPDFLIDDLLVEGSLSLLVGPSGTYKSFVAVGIAGCVACGLSWYGRTVKQMPVVYVSGEGAGGMGHRQIAWEIENATPLPDSCYFLPEAVQFHMPGDVTALIESIKKLPEAPGLVIVDTLARCMVGGNENDAKDMGQFVAGADKLRETFGCHVLIVHHFGLENRSRGSTALPGAIDTQIVVKRDGERLTLSCGKQKDFAEFEPIGFMREIVSINDEGGSSLIFRPTEQTAQQIQATAHEAQALQILDQYEAGATDTEWKAACVTAGLGARSFYNYKKSLIVAGSVMQTGKTFVAIVPEVNPHE